MRWSRFYNPNNRWAIIMKTHYMKIAITPLSFQILNPCIQQHQRDAREKMMWLFSIHCLIYPTSFPAVVKWEVGGESYNSEPQLYRSLPFSQSHEFSCNKQLAWMVCDLMRLEVVFSFVDWLELFLLFGSRFSQIGVLTWIYL